MQLPLRLASILGLFFAQLCAAAPQRRPSSIGATYLMTNSDQGNNIVTFEVTSNGTVEFSGSVRTEGLGGAYGGNPGPDAIRSGNSMIVSGTRLYAVNPGSDSVSVFDIDPNNPSQINRIGQPVNSGGNFPVSVAVSSRNGDVCVLNAGIDNGVQCFRPTPVGLAMIPGSKRSMEITGSSNPPPTGNTINSVSTIVFSPNGRKLIVDVKGLTDGTPGYLAVWHVKKDGSLSKDFTTFQAPASASGTLGAQNFGMTYLNGKEGYITADSTQGGLLYDFSQGYDPSTFTVKAIATPSQKITCWVSYASKSDSYFFTDAGSEILTEYSIDDSSLETTIVGTYPLPSNVVALDSVVGTFGNNQYLYQLAAVGGSLFVLDVQPNGGSSVIQNYNFTQFLNINNIPFNPTMSGIAVYSGNLL